MLIFVFAASVQRFLHIPFIFRWYNGQWMMKSQNSLQLYVDKCWIVGLVAKWIKQNNNIQEFEHIFCLSIHLDIGWCRPQRRTHQVSPNNTTSATPLRARWGGNPIGPHLECKSSWISRAERLCSVPRPLYLFYFLWTRTKSGLNYALLL